MAPKRKCSFGLCSANGKANSIINAIALVATVFLAAWFVVPIIEPYSAGFITSTDTFVIYLIIINVLAYVVLTIDWHVGSKLPGDEELRHTWINLIAMAGGVLGQLFALVQRTRPCKDNATWYMLTISELLLWIVICLIAFGVIHPNHVVIDLENFLSLKWFLVYLLIINVLTFIIYLFDKKKHTKLDLSELACLLLAILGGSIGALFAISITGRKRGSAHFRIGIPVVLISQSIIVMLLLISA